MIKIINVYYIIYILYIFEYKMFQQQLDELLKLFRNVDKRLTNLLFIFWILITLSLWMLIYSSFYLFNNY